MLSVLQLWKTDFLYGGGGAIAMHRLHTGLRRLGIDSKILCNRKTVESPYTVKISHPKMLQVIESRLKKVTSRLGLNDIHAISSFSIARNKVYLDADVVNFHGIHGGFISYLALPSLTKDKPAVFTLHDMWAYTGHCAYSYDCERWKTGCGNCPYPDNHPTIKRDNTHLEWNLKNWVYGRSNLVIVTLSTMQTKQVRQSLLSRFPVHQIPNGVDTEVFEPLDPEQCRALLGIPREKKVLMLAALRLNQMNKGPDLLLNALRALPKSLRSETVLLTIGNGGDVIGKAPDMQVINLGYVSHDRLKAIAYSAADVFVSPTRAESFGLVLLESMACGTPVIAFGVGGALDLVRPSVTGCVAEPEHAEGLCDCVVRLLDDKHLRNVMGENSRLVALKEYSLDKQVQQYAALYHQLTESNTHKRKLLPEKRRMSRELSPEP